MLSRLRKALLFPKHVLQQRINPTRLISVTSYSSQKQFPTVHTTTPFKADLTSELTNDLNTMNDSLPQIIDELVEVATLFGTNLAGNHLRNALEHCLPDGKRVRGLTALIVQKQLIGDAKITAEKICDGVTVAWCVEVLQAAILMADDIIDRGEVRRGKKCWYRLDHVQTLAVNDAMMMENCVYVLLKKRFGHLPSYIDLFKLFHETMLLTTIGQSLDCLIGREDINEFSMKMFETIADYKAAHFAFYVPVAAPLILNGYSIADHKELFDDIKAIGFEMGRFYQAQNDFLDCFVDPVVLMKPGTDIEEKKCTWLAAKALELASKEQRNVTREGLGQTDPEIVERVKQVYRNLEMPKIYIQYEKSMYTNIRNRIFQLNHAVVVEDVLLKLLDRLFNKNRV